MKRLLLFSLMGVAFVAASSRPPETTLQEISWPELARTGSLTHGVVVSLPDQSAALKLEHPEAQPLQATLFTIEAPKITSTAYAITGEVRYENVAPDGYLEMWNHFPDGGAYFTRTLAEQGPMAKLRGTSDWQPFSLPFNATGAKSAPSKLVVNLHLAGRGTVLLRNVKLKQMPSITGLGGLQRTGNAQPLVANPGLLAGIAGAAIGIMGSLMEWGAARGKMRRFVLVGSWALIGVGVVALLAGIAAATLRQPYAVWYPLVLLGVLCVAIFPYRLSRYQARYQEMELRRMSSLDAA